MWTPYQTRNHNNNNSNELSGRQEMYSHRDYLQALLESGSVHHDSSVEQFDEDRRMLAFFDSLLQRELGRGHNDSSDDDTDDLSITIDSSDDIDDSSFRISQSEDEDSEDMTLEDINSQTVDLTDSTTHFNNGTEILSSRARHPTIVSLAKNYRIHYVQMIKAIITENTSCPSEKHGLESPTMTTVKRQRSSSNYSNTLQALRNRIQNEENEQFYFNDERRM
ncbi:unnamed protein product [Rotaria socialis]|nr:unnamed protein product [Rotaria socialis]